MRVWYRLYSGFGVGRNVPISNGVVSHIIEGYTPVELAFSLRTEGYGSICERRGIFLDVFEGQGLPGVKLLYSHAKRSMTW